MYYSEEFIEEVRQRNDIVDVISGYVNLKKAGAILQAYVRFIMKRRLLFRFREASRCITALAVEQVVMFLPFLWNMKI